MSLFKYPWAKKNHYHSDPTLLKYGVCSGCGHLILIGQVRNKAAQVIDRRQGFEWTATYGESCIPPWDTKEIGIDGEVKYYKDGNKIDG